MIACHHKPSILRLTATVTLSLFLAACSIKPTPLTDSERSSRVKEDMTQLLQIRAPLSGEVDLYQAMARAVKFNLDHRLKSMEAALSQRILDINKADLLPSLATSAGYEGRNNFSASDSRSITTGQQSLETSTSQDRSRSVYDLRMSWNILDFGLSYVRANQQADRALIAEERRRKVIHNIIQDTRSAYWRAVSSERLLSRIGPLRQRVEAALADSETIQTRKLRSPLEALTYRRSLLEILRQLKSLQSDLIGSRIHLATLMNLPPGTRFKLAVPSLSRMSSTRIKESMEELEQQALLNRPELREEDYQTRITAAETKTAILKMLPGIDLSGGHNFDSNSYSLENHWWDYSAKISWSLMNIVTAPSNMALAEVREQVVQTRRLALSMAVMSQVHVSSQRIQQANSQLVTARKLQEVESAILEKIQAEHQARRRGELDLIRAEMNLVLANLRQDLAYGSVQNAMGQMMVSVGHNPMPEEVGSHDLDTLSAAIRQSIESWLSGGTSTAKASTPEQKQTQAVVTTTQTEAEKPQTPAMPVLVKAATQAPEEKSESTEATQARDEKTYRYTLQEGSYRFVHEAETAMARLRKKGYEPFMVTLQKKRRPWYAVRVMRFKGFSEAKKQSKIFKRKMRKEPLILSPKLS